jgi:hypothetical protein
MYRSANENQRLRRQYQQAASELAGLARRRHPTPAEAITMRVLKKEKLRLKDLLLRAGAAMLTLSCGTISDGNTTPSASNLARAVSEASEDGDALRGGRVYDRFYGENPGVGFSPDAPDTTARDGDGGPNDDGTLLDGDGRVVDNQSGHGYRMKNFFGWDLRGADGIYGPDYQDEPYVMPINLIEDSFTRLELASLFVDGESGVPAWGEVMPEQDLADLVAFVMAVRERDLPQPGDIWELDEAAPSGYVLKPGARISQGHTAIAAQCGNSACHGADGTNILFDDGEFSLGSMARASAYEAWLKIVAGNPGSPMRSQLPATGTGTVKAQFVLDVLAALCDQTAYPLGEASEADVPANDPRCGSYMR